MNMYEDTLRRDAEAAYKKFIRSSKGLFGVYKKKKGLKSFKDAQKEEQAHSSSNIGIREVPLDKIIGSVEKYKDFDINFVPKTQVIKGRWINIYIAYEKGEALPPAILYKIKDNYYVYDGNHRISVAKFLNFPSIEAEVIEFLPSGETIEDLIYREHFIFEKETGLLGLMFTEPYKYEKLDLEIKEYRKFLKEKKQLDITYKEAAAQWYRDVFKNIINILESNEILKYYNHFNINDLFTFVLDHKYFLSKEKKRNVGYLCSTVDFINMIKTNADISLSYRCEVKEEVRDNYLKLKKIDLEQKLSINKIQGNEILLKITGIDFEYDEFIFELIENYQKVNEIADFKEAVKKWYNLEYTHLLKYFIITVKKLPEKYSRYLKIFTSCEKKVFNSINNFRRLHYHYTETDSPELIDWKSSILNYIIEIYINVIDGIIESNVPDSKVISIYYTIEKEYFYLLRNEKILMMENKSTNYSKIKEVDSTFTLNWFGKRFKTGNVSEILIDERYEEFREEMKTKENRQKFEKAYYKYNGIRSYSSYMKLEELLNVLGAAEFITKMDKDMKLLASTSYIVRTYKTLEVLKGLCDEKEEITFIDFYADIIYYGLTIAKDSIFIDILDTALDYLVNEHGFVILG